MSLIIIIKIISVIKLLKYPYNTHWKKSKCIELVTNIKHMEKIFVYKFDTFWKHFTKCGFFAKYVVTMVQFVKSLQRLNGTLIFIAFKFIRLGS